jgi:hypothetical protein
LEGDAEPTAITIVLLSQDDQADAAAYRELAVRIGNKKMTVLSSDDLAAAVELVVSGHPLRELLDPSLDEALEEVALGSAEASRQLRSSRSIRRMTAEALKDAKNRAEASGRLGEVLVNDWLQGEVAAGRLLKATWVAEINAVHPWDFDIIELTGELVRVEVKSTTGPFERSIHISQAEIESAAGVNAPRTDLYRTSEINSAGGLLSICRDVAPLATEILQSIAPLSPEIVPDGYSVKPVRFGAWEKTFRILPADEEDS